MHSLTKELAEVFAEDSDNDRTFYGFPEEELSDLKEGNVHWGLEDEDGTQHHRSPQQQQVKRSCQPFRLRVALRSVPTAGDSTDDDNDDDEDKENRNMRRVKKAGKTARVKNEKHVKFEDKETAVARPSPSEDHGSDMAEDAPDSFLAKREQNIKANKAMLAQLMADLQKMPGGEGLLRLQAGKKPKKERSSRPARAGGESRKNPERTSRRQTRSMGACEDPSQEAEVERSLEDELLEVRHAPQRRGAPRPSQSKPHIVRPVEDITEDELQLIADNMTEKVYNRVTGSTCHQCRQKTIDTKTCCRSDDCRGIQGQFCGPCLRNRYGEDVKKALLDPEWRCPPCRGICNCSFCRQRDGRCPTGILFPLAQYHGFSDVHSYLTSLRNKLKSEADVEM